MKKMRLDRLIVERGLASTREKARRLILAGEVLVNDRPAGKPGTMVAEDAATRLRHPPSPFVGRGGEKLAGALIDLQIDVSGRHALDIGASTGGFTDCLLQAGAHDVIALDVGRGQLDWKLRSDARVRVIDGVNARHLEPGDFPDRFDLVTIDVSFISLGKILPATVPLLREGGRVLALVKPQFELSREEIDRGGVVRDAEKHLAAVTRVVTEADRSGLAVDNLVASRITGAEGNREFFLLMSAGKATTTEIDRLLERARTICRQE